MNNEVAEAFERTVESRHLGTKIAYAVLFVSIAILVAAIL